MIETAVFDTKPYDRQYLAAASSAARISWRFHEFRLSAETAAAAKGARAVCVFVNDRADRACLEILAGFGVKLLALRCAGFNQVDLSAARELGLAVVLPAMFRILREYERGVIFGLGLYITKGFVEAHEGRVSVESAPDRGSTFRVWFPAAPFAEDSAPQPGPRP